MDASPSAERGLDPGIRQRRPDGAVLRSYRAHGELGRRQAATPDNPLTPQGSSTRRQTTPARSVQVDPVTGEVRWIWVSPERIVSDIIVTRSHLLVATEAKVSCAPAE